VPAVALHSDGVTVLEMWMDFYRRLLPRGKLPDAVFLGRRTITLDITTARILTQEPTLELSSSRLSYSIQVCNSSNEE
jgi:hypothetical protein